MKNNTNNKLISMIEVKQLSYNPIISTGKNPGVFGKYTSPPNSALSNVERLEIEQKDTQKPPRRNR